ncbi:hypothetical protein KP001_07880 [Geomonas subterranea]|uniref:Sulphur transport domain-containing protein n=1 Tax=Geomonas subterranea TaxID=2847989 RepID=A0ABX8LL63_9BACT|nr:hypothetical protein [Geomonas subterranea]QXE92432.1 hypothetical protein KP001_07880 [Geomonas subterranea]QXM09469.1 hypothetical protein KP002_21390 [Geomonas subterranea]
MTKLKFRWQQWLPWGTFLGVCLGHALYVRYQAAIPTDGWADVGVGQGGLWGFDYYVQAQDYYMGFSYGLGSAFAVWAWAKYVTLRQAAMAAGAAGSITLVGILMSAGCFLVGCCGSPMLGVYAGIFGIKALGVGKPLMAIITVMSVGFGYCYLSRRLSRIGCADSNCKCKPL